MRVVVVTNIPTPYRIPVYERVRADFGVDLRVIYLAERESNRHWVLPQTTVPSVTLRSRVLHWHGRYIHVTTGVWRALAAARPDVVVTTGFNPPQLVAFAFAVLNHVPHVVQTDGTPQSEERLGLVHRVLRRVETHRSRAFVAASDAGLELVRSWGAPPEVSFKSPLAVDNGAFLSHRGDPKDVDLLFSGQLSDVKNPLFALDVARRSATHLGRRITIAVIGDGPLREQVVVRAAELASEIEVMVPGFQQQSSLPAWFGRARVFLFPTRWDPWGLVLNEAAAAGMPLVASRFAGSARELVLEGETGYVLDLDASVWADRVAELLADSDRSVEMGAAAAARVKSFDFDAAAAGIAAAAAAALGSSDSSRSSPQRPRRGRGRTRRVLIDVLGAPARSGGMRLHASMVLDRWVGEHDDDVVIVGPPWVQELGLPPTVRHVWWPNDNPVLRAVGQHVVVPIVYRVFHRQRLLATNSVLSRFMPASRSTIVAHDWRHVSRPAEFSRAQLLYRSAWRRSARRAAQVVAVSSKTADDTRRVIGRSDVWVVENGRDHPAQWHDDGLTQPLWLDGGPYLLTYGHHTNKRPELVLESIAASAALSGLAVVVLGAKGPIRVSLQERAKRLGLTNRVVLAGYVPDAEYRWLVSNAAALVLASSEEGFALPLAEAAFLGVPSVVTVDSGVAEMFADSAVVAEPDPDSLAEAIVTALRGGGTSVETGDRTWSSVVERLHAIVWSRVGFH